MNDFLTNKIIEDLLLGVMTPQEAWTNLQECRETISDEKYDEIHVLITEQLLNEEVIEEEVDLDDLFRDNQDSTTSDNRDDYYEGDWSSDIFLFEKDD